jgi:hypothetical protein
VDRGNRKITVVVSAKTVKYDFVISSDCSESTAGSAVIESTF